MTTTARQDCYQRIDKQHMTPLWEVLGALVPKAPTSPLQAAGQMKRARILAPSTIRHRMAR